MVEPKRDIYRQFYPIIISDSFIWDMQLRFLIHFSCKACENLAQLETFILWNPGCDWLSLTRVVRWPTSNALLIDGFPDVLAFNKRDNIAIEHSEIEPEPVNSFKWNLARMLYTNV